MTTAEIWVPTPATGRVLVRAAESASGTAQWLVGFHGYGESAERCLEQLVQVPGVEGWTAVAIEALHPFYDKRGEVIASWMTRRGRERAILDNRRYVVAALGAVADQIGAIPQRLVLVGFSQGASMVSRAAAEVALDPRFAAALTCVVTLGGDLAPELRPEDLRRFRSVVVARGTEETWYGEEKLAADTARLAESGVEWRALEYKGGHEWTEEFRLALGGILSPGSPAVGPP